MNTKSRLLRRTALPLVTFSQTTNLEINSGISTTNSSFFGIYSEKIRTGILNLYSGYSSDRGNTGDGDVFVGLETGKNTAGKENSIQLKEINLKLLQELEELTLYTIEQEHKIYVQEEKNKTQESRLEKKEELLRAIKN